MSLFVVPIVSPLWDTGKQHRETYTVVQMAPSLRTHLGGGYNGAMRRENKTEYLRFRVRASFKAKIERLADATGRNATELIEAAVDAFERRPEVRQALADLDKTSQADMEGE